MDSIDLLALVKRFGKLDNIELYGYISSRLPKPFNLFDSCSLENNGLFVKMDVLAVNLQNYSQHLKELGITNKENNDIYLVNGSIALYVKSNGVYPDWYSTRGTLRLGSKTDSSYLTLFKFMKSGNNWSIGCNTLDTMDISTWGRDSRLYLSVNKSLQNGFVTVPDDVAKLQRFFAKQTQGVVVPVQQSQPRSLNSNLQSASNGVKPVEVLTTRSNFEVKNRDTILEEPKMLKDLEDKLTNVKAQSDSFIIDLKNDYCLDEETHDKVKFMAKSLRNHLKAKPHNTASTGRMLLKKYLSLFGSYSEQSYLGSTAGQYLIDDFSEVSEFICDYSKKVNVDGSAWTLCKKAFANSDLFYSKMLGIIIGVDPEKLGNTCMELATNDISFVKLITDNPYLLLLVSSDYSYNEVDYIAYCLGKLNNKDIEDYKLIGIMYDYLNNSDVGSTCYMRSNIINSKIGVSLSKAKYNNCKTRGTYLTDTVLSNIYFYIDDSLCKNDYKYPDSGWIQQGMNYVFPLSKSDLENGLSLALKYGIASEIISDNTKWVTSTRILTKEVYVCRTMYDLCSRGKKGYDHSLIDAYIDEYERNVGFKLEKEQREAVHLVDNYVAIVTGPAGSGKTTVSDCMVYVLNKLESDNIEYAAPTGKAAKRLQEVVKSKVQTFNSKFKIFGSSSSLIDYEDYVATDENITYFFDEVAMSSLDLFYSVCRRLSLCNLYLLGDICQLPPIGKGLPFKNLLRFLPCVKLNVTKRSAENSGITFNSKIINEFSEPSNWQPLKEAEDFKIIPCNDDDLSKLTVLLCKFHLGTINDSEMNELCNLSGKNKNDFIKIDGLTPDDIQVVSPIGKQTYSWGTYQLNKELQLVFNKTKGYSSCFKYQVSEAFQGTKFIIGDRVIHTDSNMYSMQWYSSYKDGSFQKTYGFGISNGDVGKVVAFYPSQSCEILSEVGNQPKDFKYPENLRDDSTFISQDNWFIVVEYYDFMSDSNYYILYRATENFNVNSSECKVFFGDDLKKLALFYAGTTHKMQGSQAKLILGIIGRVNFKGFLTRNMLYTEVTRASEGVYLLGSVSNDRNSQLSIARSCVADEGVNTIQELIFT